MEKNLQKNRPKISCRIAIPTGNSSHISSVCLFVKEQSPSPPAPAAYSVILYTIYLFSKRDSDAVCAYFSVFFAYLYFTPLSFLCQYISHENYFLYVLIVRHLLVILHNKNCFFFCFMSPFGSSHLPFSRFHSL